MQISEVRPVFNCFLSLDELNFTAVLRVSSGETCRIKPCIGT